MPFDPETLTSLILMAIALASTAFGVGVAFGGGLVLLLSILEGIHRSQAEQDDRTTLEYLARHPGSEAADIARRFAELRGGPALLPPAINSLLRLTQAGKVIRTCTVKRSPEDGSQVWVYYVRREL